MSIPKSKQQQNPVGSGVSAKCETLRLAQKSKSPGTETVSPQLLAAETTLVPAHFGTATLLFSHFLRMPKLHEQLLG